MKSCKHKLLVANASITDDVFANSVIFIFEHSAKGAEGVILNSKIESGQVGFGPMKDILNVETGKFDVIKDLIINGDLQSVPLFSGGPCKTEGTYFMHGHEECLKNNNKFKNKFDLGIPNDFSIEDGSLIEENPFSNMYVTEGFYFGSPTTFAEIIESGKFKENKFRFFTGQSKWCAGQLEYEIENGAWSVINSNPNLFFDLNALNKLSESVNIQKSSLFPKMSSQYNPSWN